MALPTLLVAWLSAYSPPANRVATPSAAKSMSRRALLPLPLVALPFAAAATDGLGMPQEGTISDTFAFKKSDGTVKQLTEIEAREELTKKLEAATAAGKGLDIERRGQFNEKALFSEDFYFKYGLRPTPEDMEAKPLEELPFVPVQRRYTGYKKYQERISTGLALYSDDLKQLIDDRNWQALGPFLEIGAKSTGSNKQGDGTGVPAAPVRSFCRALGLFANTVLQSENDNGATSANLLVLHFVNELYFCLDDIAAAAKAGDQKAAKTAWTRGKDYINAYLVIANKPINAKVGDKFPMISAAF